MIVLNKDKNFWYDYSGDRIMVKHTSQGCNLELYESNLPPLLRYFHIYNISPSGWILIRTYVSRIPKKKKTTCTFEYECNVNQIIPQPKKETVVPYKICSFDIEASSSHGHFPLPIKTYKRLAANMIDVFYKQKRFLNTEQSLTLIEKVINSAFGFNKCQDIDCVFPKDKSITETRLSSLIKRLFEYNLNGNTICGNVSKMMTIESLFSKDNDNENVNNIDDDNYGDNNDSVYIEKVRPRKYEMNERTLFGILNSYADKDRDDKVNKINKILTTILPPLEGDKITFIGSTFVKLVTLSHI